ncbi:MAG: Ig-like domain-containing protein, partial [Actinomycetia bacterium]|nr:Ig-like domain-containing protein [Actinomycetes bacterium]
MAGKPGSAEPGATVTLTWPDGSTSDPVTVTPDGSWSLPTPEGMKSGDVTATATDTAGNTSAPTTVPLDTQAPDAPVITTANKATVAGTAEPGSTVTLTWPDGTTATTTADPSGAWSLPTPDDMASGLVTATATDAAGNTSKPATHALDTQAPDAPVITTANKATVAGTAEPDSTVTLTWPDGTTATTTADADGAWSVPTPAGMPSGDIAVTATDAAGNTSEEATAYLDTQAPAAPVITTANATTIGGTEPAPVDSGTTVTITYPTPGGPKTVTTDVKPDGTWSVPTPSDAMSGPIAATATDPAGNVSSPTIAHLDTQAPDAPVITTANAAQVAGTAEPGATVEVMFPDGTVRTATADSTTGAWSIPTPPGMTSGVVTATATDPAGNTSTPATHDLDTQAPDAPVVNTANGTKVAGTAEPGATVEVTFPGGATQSTVADPDGNWTVTTPAGTPSGDLTAVATDPAGNPSTPTTHPIDTQAPEPPSIHTANGTEVAGTAEPGSTIEVTWPDGTTDTTTADAGGAWSVETPKGMPSGEVGATATDAAGNTSDPASTHLDTDPVGAPEITTANATVVEGKASDPVKPDSTVRLTWPNGEVSPDVPLDSDGTFSVTTPAGMPSGVVKAVVIDVAGNVSPEGTHYLDTVVPDAPVIAVANGTMIAGAEPAPVDSGTTITVTYPTANGPKTVTADVNPDGTWSVATPPDAVSGEVTAVATDPAGNVSGPATHGLDTLAPDAPVIAVANGTAVSGTAEPGSTVTVMFPDDPATVKTVTAGQDGAWTVDTPAGMVSGHEVTATATDPAGNVSPEAKHLLDTLAPDAPVIEVANGTAVAGTAEPGSTVTVTFPGGATQTVTADPGTGAWTVTTPQGTKSGTVAATATDPAGNVSVPATAPIDTEAPDAPVIDTANA